MEERFKFRHVNAITGTFVESLNLGSSMRCIVAAMGREVIVTQPDAAGLIPPSPGTPVRLAWGRADGQLLADET